MHKKGFIDMVKGLLAWLNKVFWVFKVLWSNSFVSNAIGDGAGHGEVR